MVDQLNLEKSLEITSLCTVKNRIFKAPMGEVLATWDGSPTKELFNLYQAWAQGGSGLQVTGNVMVDRNALVQPRSVVLDDQSDLSLFKLWAQAGRQNNTQMWMQINHPGKQIPSILSKEPVAPSAVPLRGGLEKTHNCPRELTDPQIWEIIRKFAWAAEQAKNCGFDGVQIHGAHGFLISQFLSPHHNRRTDLWGGALKNRMRFLREVYAAIRQAVGSEFPVGVKLNSTDFQKGGFNEEESVQVFKALQDDGINLIEISGGNYENPKMIGHNIKESTLKPEAYFLDYAQKAQKELDVPLVVTGGFRSVPVMEAALESGAADMIGLGRPMALYPDLANRLLADRSYCVNLKPLTTGVALIDYHTLLNVTWYQHQLSWIGHNKPTRPDFNTWRSVMKTVGISLGHVFQYKSS
jgi:2,4-dienoyl-CoA reductase-like NADH-dependent reductase (Old Yellow Enzyme family)